MRTITVQRTSSTYPESNARVPYREGYPGYGPVKEFETVEEAQAKVDEMVTKEYRGRTWEVLIVEHSEATPYSKTGEKDEARINGWGAGANGQGDGWKPETTGEASDETTSSGEGTEGA